MRNDILSKMHYYENRPVLLLFFRLIIRNSESVKVLEDYHDHNNGTNTVAIANDISFKYFNQKNFQRRRLGFTKDRLIMFTNVFYYQRWSVLKDLFDHSVKRLHQNGLVKIWAGKYYGRKLKPIQKKATSLEIENLFAVLQICAIMYLISFMVFIIEVISRRHRRLRYILDYFTY